MHRVSLATLAIALLLAGGPAGCGGPAPGAEPEPRTVLATGLQLVGTPGPDSRRLTVRYAASALLRDAEPVARVEIEQDAARVVLRVFVNERVPDADEAVPNVATIRTTTVDLDQPLGGAAVLDGSATPPASMPPAD